MIRKVVFSVAVALAAFAGRSDVLYWEVDESDAALGDLKDAYEYGQVSVYEGSDFKGYLKLYDSNGQLSDSEVAAKNAGVTWADLNGYASSSYSFAVEILNNSLEVIGTSGYVNYTDLAAYVSTGAIGVPTFAGNAFTGVNGGGAYSVPEPSGGLLLLMGGALLALRRRRK